MAFGFFGDSSSSSRDERITATEEARVIKGTGNIAPESGALAVGAKATYTESGGVNLSGAKNNQFGGVNLAGAQHITLESTEGASPAFVSDLVNTLQTGYAQSLATVIASQPGDQPLPQANPSNTPPAENPTTEGAATLKEQLLAWLKKPVVWLGIAALVALWLWKGK